MISNGRRAVSTGLLFRHNDDLECVNFPNLEMLDGHLGIYAHDNAKLRTITLPELTHITANLPEGFAPNAAVGLVWYDNPLLEEIDLSSLTFVEANREKMEFNDNPLLHTVWIK